MDALWFSAVCIVLFQLEQVHRNHRPFFMTLYTMARLLQGVGRHEHELLYVKQPGLQLPTISFCRSSQELAKLPFR